MEGDDTKEDADEKPKATMEKAKQRPGPLPTTPGQSGKGWKLI